MTGIPIFSTNNRHQSNLQCFLYKLIQKLNDKINYLMFVSYNLVENSMQPKHLITKITFEGSGFRTSGCVLRTVKLVKGTLSTSF